MSALSACAPRDKLGTACAKGDRLSGIYRWKNPSLEHSQAGTFAPCGTNPLGIEPRCL
ncbi:MULTISPECIES: hypothetical protein [Nostocales]|uniref:Lipoprotein n=2 Tax=Nostocales TaxID=1161 RepID=A0ABW8WY19_9CYAN|nr:hypothetical protein [Tolypothrix bouteillei]